MKRWQGWLLVILLVIPLWLAVSPSSPAMIRTIEEAPNQVVVQSRHQLRDNRGFTWQVILFSRRDQLQLRLVGFPEQYHFRHPDPLLLITAKGQTLTAVDDFPKADSVANVGQFDLLPLVPRLPQSEPLVLRPPLEEQGIEIAVPAAVVIEWHALMEGV
ncbi:DUF3122 domain-containing protein [Thermosynechococcus sp. JY1334]|uniref:DUF3122 domain-containing protein n=1 Tax=unclassified Thermosynechococcus TaxID=2622553 RepID=UPI002670E0EB|nr:MULTISPECIES: DUF3122 domain-containing protein [unclassified Thermosynechococcus]MDR7897379.1 DUF3122 domain-containing protein [Thermosynechococcus sp. JY1332]MDR7904782.1 DUF3122 domain-containing protein [Thermosynechococcus sp. JY1334]MDR7992607.1 DUF3122 domain-containing protein [Thermosynechococcus sp. TG252]WKT87009.1 DUF3122 domain-containing protein [Thermosynechococcus sp. JY1339]WNC55952.1 DUF3122 domain-containing protein [Thermosynechococcus sp. JY1331]